MVLAAMGILLFFWMIPVTALAGLLSYKEIKKTWPALARLIDRNDQIRAIVQNSLPSVAMISLNACLPFLLEGVFIIIKGARFVLLICSRTHIRAGLSCAQLDRVLAFEKVSLLSVLCHVLA